MSAPAVRKLDPTALPLEEASRVLSRISHEPVTVEQLEQDLEAGAPTNADGTLNLVHYAAWLLREMKRGDRS